MNDDCKHNENNNTTDDNKNVEHHDEHECSFGKSMS